MAPTYKLTYFNFPALAEPIRFLLSYGGVDFEDVRIERENWASIKPTMPMGQVPVLEVDGRAAGQSLAISRYLAKQFKLTGDSDWENLEIDAIVDTINDLRIKIIMWYHEKDAATKEAKKPALFNETIPFYLERLEGMAKKNKGHFVAKKLTWADVYFAGILDHLTKISGMDVTADNPNLKAVVDNVLAIPNIQAWLKKRPNTT